MDTYLILILILTILTMAAALGIVFLALAFILKKISWK